jgi:DNA-binding MarR family transcriptional regulator
VDGNRQAEFDAIDEARSQWANRWGPELSDAVAAATSIMRAQQLVLSSVDRVLRPLDLTFARYEALMLLYFSRQGALPLGKMGDRLMVHQTSITNIVDRLESQALVKRVPHPEDGRTTLAYLTEDGRNLAKRASRAVNEITFGLSALNKSDVEHLVRIIRKLRRGEGDMAI